MMHKQLKKELLKQLGNVLLDEHSRITDFVEKPANPNPAALVSTAIYLYTPETINDLRQYVREGNNLDKSGSFIQWLHKNKPFYGYLCNGAWYDIGSQESLEKERKEFQG